MFYIFTLILFIIIFASHFPAIFSTDKFPDLDDDKLKKCFPLHIFFFVQTSKNQAFKR